MGCVNSLEGICLEVGCKFAIKRRTPTKITCDTRQSTLSDLTIWIGTVRTLISTVDVFSPEGAGSLFFVLSLTRFWQHQQGKLHECPFGIPDAARSLVDHKQRERDLQAVRYVDCCNLDESPGWHFDLHIRYTWMLISEY